MTTSEKPTSLNFWIFIIILCFIGVHPFVTNTLGALGSSGASGTSDALGTSGASGAQKNDQNPNNLPSPAPPKPQFFCGYCHVITYPNVVQKSYELWKKDKHKEVACIECHYPPDKQKVQALAAKFETGSEQKLVQTHIPAVAPDRFSYLNLGGETIQTRPRIVDDSCMTSSCHGKPDDKFKTKKIKFTKKVTFVHTSHLDPEKQIEGQKLQCTSCHQHETSQKKFEVTQASCHQCHFTNTKFNLERGKCTLCHELPEKPIQTSGEKPITHEILQKAGVSCASCHIDLIQAAGGGKVEAYFEKDVLQTAITLGTQTIKKGNCKSCHDWPEQLKPEQLEENANKKLMHEKHVTIKNARCFDCHKPITHTRSGTKPTPKEPNGKLSLASTIQAGCTACHAKPHQYQIKLARGEKRKDVLDAVDPMYKVRTNCFGCHNEFKSTDNGQMVLGASGKTCVKCHTKDHEKMLQDWKTELKKEVEYSREIMQEAVELLNQESKLSQTQVKEAETMMKQGREYMNLVIYGNGVHNKKYSIMLIDAAISSFEDVMDYVSDIQSDNLSDKQ